MASLPEQSQWEDGIYQLEQTDPVIGGGSLTFKPPSWETVPGS